MASSTPKASLSANTSVNASVRALGSRSASALSSLPAPCSKRHEPLAGLQPSGSTRPKRKRRAPGSDFRNWWHLRKLHTDLNTEEKCVQFAEERGLLPREKTCDIHKQSMPLSVSVHELGEFHCPETDCTSKAVSRAKGTWFERAPFPLVTLFEIMYMFCHNISYEDAQLETANFETANFETDLLSIATIAEWYGYCQECVVVYELEHQNYNPKIGGTNKMVQLDEFQFDKREFNCGRHIKGHWVIGMIQDQSDDLRLEVCAENELSADVLVPLIKKHVQEGSTVHAEFRQVYDCLLEHGYNMLRKDGINTQRVENRWRMFKRAYHKEQAKCDIAEWLIVNNWRRKIRLNHRDPFEELLTAVKYAYPLDNA